VKADGKMISVEQAVALVQANAVPLPPVDIDVDKAVGRVLAEPVCSDVDMPPFDKSAMDGYAVRAADLGDAPTELTVIEDIPAGTVPTQRVEPGSCSRIMTGAPVPERADAVIRVEDTAAADDGRVRFERPVRPGDNICRLGEDVRSGQEVLPVGRLLRPVDIGVASAAGATVLSVHPLPSVAVIATGDEVIEIDQKPEGAQIRNSNSHLVCSRLRQFGIAAEYLGIAPDDSAGLTRAIQEGLKRDVMVISGGVSMGDYDLVPGVLVEQGVELLFQSVAVKPGRPVVFGRRGDGLVFGLPGNPVANLVATEMFLLPAIRRRMGEESPGPVFARAVLTKPVSHKGGRTSLKPVTIERTPDGWRATPVEYHGSADLAGAARGDAFVEIPQGTLELPAEATVRLLTFPDNWRTSNGT
jgi:molybdopterin molybdotransferase